MNTSVVAERYARALFELALEKGVVEDVYHNSQLIISTCENSRELRLLLKSPIINSGKKTVILKELFEKALHPLTMTYILIMVRKGRESFIQNIAVEFIEYYQAYRNILTVYFKSPVNPDEEVRKRVLDLMKNFTSADIDLKSEIDESLVGGFILHWDDKQYDASIRREIENLRNAIARVNLYKKEF